MKKAVHFGAGNIGRGFIGLLLNLSGYEVTFIDVDDRIVTGLNKAKGYRVIEVGEGGREYTVSGVKAVNGKDIPNAVQKISKADIVTTAVGPGALRAIAPVIAEGLVRRFKAEDPGYLNIIACENTVKASSLLKDYVYEELDKRNREKADMYAGFPDAVVDRIIPPQETEETLDVKVETFKEWIADRNLFKGEIPEIKGMELTDNLTAFVERKIFTLNTGHAGTAYMAYCKGHRCIHEAIEDKEIYDTVKGALLESGISLIELYNFSAQDHKEYIERILRRFKNPELMDSVVRVGRDPLRKLGPEDRLVKPAERALKYGVFPENLCRCIAAGLFFDAEGDEGARKMQAIIKEKGIEKGLEDITGLKPSEPLGQRIISIYRGLTL